MDEQQIIELYWARSENAIAETDKRYGKYCHSIAFRVLSSHLDSEECVNDAYLNVWNSIPPTRPVSLRAFLGKITRNLALKKYEMYTAQKRGKGEIQIALDEMADCVPDPTSLEEEVDGRLLAQQLNRFLSQLPAQTRAIFLRRYWELATVKEIARAYGISESSVKMSLLRTRGKLKGFLEQKGVTV